MRTYALDLLLVSAAGLVALLSHRATERLRIPVAVILLVLAAAVAEAVPSFPRPSQQLVDRLVTVGLIAILFEGGMGIGWRRFRPAAGRIAVIGIVGTFATAAGGALFLHYVLGVSGYVAVLTATAVAPTDPAVVFSVLGGQEIEGRSGVLLEGESGANDPVGIALMASLVAAGGLDGGAVADVAREFALQMVIGAAVGLVGGLALVWVMRHLTLPSESLYPLRTLAFGFATYGVATVAHGSGFLAVFLAGIVVGDVRAPYDVEIRKFHAALSSIGEVVAFIVLGLTIDLGDLSRFDVWGAGLLLAVLLTLVIRPLLVAPCLVRSGLPRGEQLFVLLAGLKGAVPILLAGMLLGARVDDPQRFYGIVVVVVIFSVVVQGSLVPSIATWLRVPMRAADEGEVTVADPRT